MTPSTGFACPASTAPPCFLAFQRRENGRWLIVPADEGTGFSVASGNTLILKTTFETADGTVCLIDSMARGDGVAHVARIVRGVRGKVRMRTELVARFGYDRVFPPGFAPGR